MAVYVDIRKTLDDFSLNVQFTSNARRIGILGASGCGKSMTLKNIAGIEAPDAGKIAINERVLYDSAEKINIKPQRRNVGYLFQNYALFPTMTVEQNIAAGLTGTKEQKRRRVYEMAERFQLGTLLHRFPAELSGGQQQRTALARIMAYEPEVILLDEPFSALDMFLKDRLQQELLEFLKEYEGTVIMVSHNRDELYRFSEDLVILNHGTVEAAGGVKELFADPRTTEAARLTGCKNIVSIKRIDAHCLEAPDWGLVLHTQREIPERTAAIGYRAHEFLPVWGERGENCMKVRLQSMAELPFEQQYYLLAETGTDSGVSQKNLCWYVQRERWGQLRDKGLPDYLELQEDQVLFLEE